MQLSKTHKFLSEWGYLVVMVVVALPILGLAFLTWSLVPTSSTPRTASAPTEAAHWRSLDVIAAFQRAGLNAEVIHGVSKDERDGFSTLFVVDARRFRISTNDAQMGMVLCFENPRDLKQMQDYYFGLNRSLPQFRSWLFVRDNVLLQINYEVPETTARAYAAVLDTLDK